MQMYENGEAERRRGSVTRSVAIVGAIVVTMDDDRRVIDGGTVVVEGGRIVAVAHDARDPRADRIIDGRGHVVMPGLINCHMHTRPGRALGDGMPLFEWHSLYPDGLCREMTVEDSRAGSLVAFAEALKSGSTTVMDMTCKPEGAVLAAEEIGIRALITPLAADTPWSDDGACDSYPGTRDVIKAVAPTQAGARVQYWLGFDGINGVAETSLREMGELARQLSIGIHGHMSESRDDAGWTNREHGLPAAAYLNRAGVLGPRTVLAHCNWLTEQEIGLLRSSGTSVSHNPTSNMKIGTGICPVPDLLAAGVNVALGTDGMLSNFHLDMFQVMRGACQLQRIHRLDAQALSSGQVLTMATRNGARAVGLGHELGSIEVGKRADLVTIDLERVHLRPFLRGRHDNLAGLLTWCARGSDVDTVLVDGQVVVERGQLTTMREKDIIARVQATAESVLHRIDTAERPVGHGHGH
jgi:5-methylthioadenosine/S-adenosylhomocysteine deaminase